MRLARTLALGASRLEFPTRPRRASPWRTRVPRGKPRGVGHRVMQVHTRIRFEKIGHSGSEFFWESTAIRNRLRPDEGVDHQPPRPGCDNFLYVRIRNRGRLTVLSPSIQVYYQEAVLAPVWRDRNTWPDQRRRWRPATPTREMFSMLADSAAFQEAVFVWRPDTLGPWSFVAAVSASQGDVADDCSLESAGCRRSFDDRRARSCPLGAWRRTTITLPFDRLRRRPAPAPELSSPASIPTCRYRTPTPIARAPFVCPWNCRRS